MHLTGGLRRRVYAYLLLEFKNPKDCCNILDQQQLTLCP